MFCEKCGNPIPEGQTSCPVCEPAPQQEVVEEISPAIAPEAPQEPEFTLNNPAEEAPKAKKGGKIVLMALAAVLALAVLLAAFNWQSIVRYFDRTFSEPADYLTRVEEKALAELASQLADAFDAKPANTSQGDCSETAFTLELSDSLKAMLGASMGQSGVDIDLDWLNSFTLTEGAKSYEGVNQKYYALSLNGTHILTLDMILDFLNYRLYIGAPELSRTYLMGESEEGELPQILPSLFGETPDELDALNLTGQEVETLINTYGGILLDGKGECTKENQKVTCGGLEQDLLVITFRMSQEEYYNLVKKVVLTIKDDALIRDIATRYDDYVAQTVGEDLGYSEAFYEGLDDFLTQMETDWAEIHEDNYLQVETFIDENDDIVGHHLTAVTVDEEPQEIYYITVTQGKEFAFQISFMDLFLEGKGTRNGEKTAASYTVYVKDIAYATVELEDLVLREEGVDGVLRLRPTKALGELLELPDTVMAVLDAVAVELGYSENTVTILVNVSGSQLLKLSVTHSVEQAAPIAVPDGISGSDEGALMDWVAKLDVKAVLNSLEKAGLPQEYLDALNEQIEEILSYIG